MTGKVFQYDTPSEKLLKKMNIIIFFNGHP